MKQPTNQQIDSGERKLKRGVDRAGNMALISIEHNPNYVGLFVHVWYGGREMVFLFSWNHLLYRDSAWVANELQFMAAKHIGKHRRADAEAIRSRDYEAS